MSTRANIIITDGYDTLFFYRHSDGYPEGVTPTLNKFLNMVKGGVIRDNAMQSAGHLILLGHEEYKEQGLLDSDYMRWKVGAYEPTTGLHGDIEYLYTIDLEQKTLTTERV
jgi:hypothetical protein